MDIFKCAAAGLIGLSGGVAIAGGVFALITMIGVFPRLIAKTKTPNQVYWYEAMLIAGGVIGSLLTVFEIHLPAGTVGLIVFGLFTGIYIGCLALALAEGLKVIPILVKRIKMHRGLPWIITAMAFGKMVGVLVQMV